MPTLPTLCKTQFRGYAEDLAKRSDCLMITKWPVS